MPWLDPFAPGPSASVVPWLVSMGCGLALWLMAVTGGASGRLRLFWLALAVVAWAALPHGSLQPETVMLAGGLGLIAIAAASVEDSGVTHAIQAGLLAAAVLSAIFGLLQYAGIAAQLGPWVSLAQAGEAYGNLRQPNQFATLCWIGAAVLLWGSLRLPPALAYGTIMLLAIGSAASVSRTGVLQGLVLTVLAMVWNDPARRQRLLLCAAAGAAYFLAAWALPMLLELAYGALPSRTLWGRLAGGAPCTSRTVLWSNVLHLAALKPFLGWGWGELDYAHYMTFYEGSRFCDILDNAHNLPLHIAVELGVPMALLATGGGLWWAWRQRPWKERIAMRQLAWAIVALIALHSLLEYPLWYGPFQIAFGASLGWLLAHPAEAGARRLHLPSAVAIAVMALATGYAAWDYARVSQIYLPPEDRHSAWREDALGHARRSWLFSGQALFADLTLSSVTRADAQATYELAQRVLHYSPEPRVIERLIESATLLGRQDEAVLHLARLRAAFPKDYEAWRRAQRLPPAPAR